MDTAYALGVLAAMAGVTFALRALPFLAARWLQSHPLVQKLGRFLPLAIMTLLLLHTLVGNAKQNPNGPWAELAAVATVVALQWWKKQALLSILAGTALYVLLRNPGVTGSHEYSFSNLSKSQNYLPVCLSPAVSKHPWQTLQGDVKIQISSPHI